MWDLLTSWWTVGIAGGLGVVGVVAAMVMLGPAVALPVIGSVLRRLIACKPCLALLALGGTFYGGLLHGSNVERTHCEERFTAARQAGDAARSERDGAINELLERKFGQLGPVVQGLSAQTSSLQQQVKDYERKIGPAGRGCRVGADALRLRASRDATGAQGRRADGLRNDP